MKPEFTAQGVSVRTFDEIFESLSDQLKAIYGSDINLDQDTPDGQLIGIFAKAILDLETFGLQLYSEFDPDFARGQLLNKLIKLVGINRRAATRSQVDVDIVTDRALTLAAGFTVADGNEQNWITLASQSLVNGSNTITLFAEDFGEIEAEANTITEPVTIVLGVASVTNPLAATPGIDEESDEDLRIRRNNSLENAAYSTVGGLVAKLGEITNVTDAVVYENDTNVVDSDGIPAHGIWALVEGGDIQDIAEILAKNKTAGTAMKGTINEIYEETIVRPDSSTFVILHNMKFDRPTDVPVYVTLTVTRKVTTSPADLDLIKANLAALSFNIGEDLQANTLYSTVYSAGTNFIATDLQISDDDVVFTDELIQTAINEKFSIDEANIDITEIIP
jgi:uncharacterized phage protein gp47/JayE